MLTASTHPPQDEIASHEERLDRTVAQLNEAGGRAHRRLCNALDEKDVQATVGSIVRDFGRIDILVNAVGGSTIIGKSGATQPRSGAPKAQGLIAALRPQHNPPCRRSRPCHPPTVDHFPPTPLHPQRLSFSLEISTSLTDVTFTHTAAQHCHPSFGAKDHIRIIQVLLGHKKLDTTALYTRVAISALGQVTSPLDVLLKMPG